MDAWVHVKKIFGFDLRWLYSKGILILNIVNQSIFLGKITKDAKQRHLQEAQPLRHQCQQQQKHHQQQFMESIQMHGMHLEHGIQQTFPDMLVTHSQSRVRIAAQANFATMQLLFLFKICIAYLSQYSCLFWVNSKYNGPNDWKTFSESKLPKRTKMEGSRNFHKRLT